MKSILHKLYGLTHKVVKEIPNEKYKNIKVLVIKVKNIYKLYI